MFDGWRNGKGSREMPLADDALSLCYLRAVVRDILYLASFRAFHLDDLDDGTALLSIRRSNLPV